MKLVDEPSKNVFFNAFWLTDDGIRYTYLIDRLLTAKQNVLIVGPSGTGKTKLIRNYTKRLKNKHFVQKAFNMTGNCQTTSLVDFVEKDLIKTRKSNVMRPKANVHHIIFIDDLNMCRGDQFDIKGPHELIRQWFDHEGWYDQRDKCFMKVKNIRFCANVSLPDATVDAPTKHLAERFMWHWAMVTLTNQDD